MPKGVDEIPKRTHRLNWFTLISVKWIVTCHSQQLITFVDQRLQRYVFSRVCLSFCSRGLAVPVWPLPGPVQTWAHGDPLSYSQTYSNLFNRGLNQHPHGNPADSAPSRDLFKHTHYVAPTSIGKRVVCLQLKGLLVHRVLSILACHIRLFLRPYVIVDGYSVQYHCFTRRNPPY